MLDFRRIYSHAEQHTTAYVVALFACLAALVAAQAFVSGFAILAIAVGISFVVITLFRPLWTLGFLAIYLPFEPFVLKFIPDDIYLFTRFFLELMIYLLVAVVVWKRLSGEISKKQTPITLPFVLFVVVAVASAIINFTPASIAILGLRQILRFILVFFIVVYLNPPQTYIRHLTIAMLAIVLFQSALGLSQAIVGEPLDQFLLPSEVRTFGDITLTSGVVQSWDPGARVFGTLGRYDRLGTFLAFFLLIGAACLYEFKKWKERRLFWWVFAASIPALLLTYSRSAWFGFLFGFLFIGLWIKRDHRVLYSVLIAIALLAAYLFSSDLIVGQLIDTPSQGVGERFFEAFSYERWRGEYYGLGRLFWIVQTVLVVVPAAPLFGFGPGQYGGGAVAALQNGAVYEQLGLPFGVYGTDGYIDNNWFSLWGETGTLGLVFYGWMFIALLLYALKVYRAAKDDAFVRALSLGFAAAMIAVALNAFLATFFEVRTLAFYLWLYGGFVVVMGRRIKV